MSSSQAKKLIKIEINEHSKDHYYLEQSDRCYYYGQYTPGGGYSCSPTNQTIANLKKKVGDGGYQYKAHAIKQVADAFRGGLNLDVLCRKYTLVPIPPSKVRGHNHYDDRMLQVLNQLGKGWDLDIRELVVQIESTEPAHRLSIRPKPHDLAENYRINESVSLPDPQKVLIVDDVLTAGAHFKAMQMVLRERYPSLKDIRGLFYARTSRDQTITDFDISDL